MLVAHCVDPPGPPPSVLLALFMIPAATEDTAPCGHSLTSDCFRLSSPVGAARTQCHRLRWLINRNILLSLMEAGSLRSQCQQIWCPMSASFQNNRPPSSSCVLTWWKGQENSMGSPTRLLLCTNLNTPHHVY